jgi:hypothetical protein
MEDNIDTSNMSKNQKATYNLLRDIFGELQGLLKEFEDKAIYELVRKEDYKLNLKDWEDYIVPRIIQIVQEYIYRWGKVIRNGETDEEKLKILHTFRDLYAEILYNENDHDTSIPPNEHIRTILDHERDRLISVLKHEHETVLSTIEKSYPWVNEDVVDMEHPHDTRLHSNRNEDINMIVGNTVFFRNHVYDIDTATNELIHRGTRKELLNQEEDYMKKIKEIQKNWKIEDEAFREACNKKLEELQASIDKNQPKNQS